MPAETLSSAKQSAVGLSLAAMILIGWAALHVYAVWFWHPVTENWPVSLLLVAGLSWLSVGLFIIAHDAMHGSLMPGHRSSSKWIGIAALAFYANFSYRRLLPKHHAHHAAPGSEADPDFHPEQPRSFWHWYARFMLTYFGYREAGWMSLRVLAYWLTGASLANILLFFALPGILSSLQLFFFGTFLPHRHAEDTFADHNHARSNNYPVIISLLSCFHFGYHHEHHLSPATPWWRLPEMRRRIKAQSFGG